MPEETLATGDTGSQQQETVTESVTETAEKPAEKPAEEQQEKATDQNADKSTETAQDGEKDTKPTEYTDFTLPEGFQMNTEQLEAFKPYATELGMNQEQAQKAIDMHVFGMQKAFEAEVEYRQKSYGDVVKEVTADKSIGEEGLGKINAMLTKYGGEEAKGFFDVAVLGASGLDKAAAKGVLQAMHKIALAAGDSPLHFGQPAGKDQDAKTLLYGDTFKK